MWKSFVSIPGLEFILSLSGFLPLVPSFPKLEPREARTWLMEFSKPVSVAGTGLLCRGPALAAEPSSVCAVPRSSTGRGSEEAGAALGSSAQSKAGHGTETSPAASAAFSLEREQLLGEPQSGIWFGRQWDVVAPPEPPRSFKRGCWCWWKRFITAVDFLSFMHWIYTSIFCISHFSDPWRSIAHSNTININSNHILVCWRQEFPSSSFRDCWALIDFYIIPVKCSWFHCERELKHRE